MSVSSAYDYTCRLCRCEQRIVSLDVAFRAIEPRPTATMKKLKDYPRAIVVCYSILEARYVLSSDSSCPYTPIIQMKRMTANL